MNSIITEASVSSARRCFCRRKSGSQPGICPDLKKKTAMADTRYVKTGEANMDGIKAKLQNECSFGNVAPLNLPLPYPPLRVRGQNQFYANLLTLDYCGSVSELTAAMQYIHGENSLCCRKCTTAKTVLGMAVAEMTHLQKLGEMILLLGGSINFSIKTRTGTQMWSPEYTNLSDDEGQIIEANLKAEHAAIEQYREHISMIEDDYVNAVLERIIQDEEYHIMLLQMLQEGMRQ